MLSSWNLSEFSSWNLSVFLNMFVPVTSFWQEPVPSLQPFSKQTTTVPTHNICFKRSRNTQSLYGHGPCLSRTVWTCRLLTYLLTYLLTPWCRVLLGKLTGLQLVKKFPVFHRTRRFITTLTSVRHLSLSWASPIQSIYPHPTSWRSILKLSTPIYKEL